MFVGILHENKKIKISTPLFYNWTNTILPFLLRRIFKDNIFTQVYTTLKETLYFNRII